MWEGGLYSLQFMEESLRSARGELVMRGSVKLPAIISRINDFIKRVAPSLPKSGTPESEAVSAEAVSEMAKLALEAAVPLMSQSILSMDMAGVGDSVVPVSATQKVDQGELTLEQAQSAKSTCSKCKFEGCSFCMGKWFVPQKVWKGKSSTVPVLATQSSTVVVLEPSQWL
jgi:hypothetical protein